MLAWTLDRSHSFIYAILFIGIKLRRKPFVSSLMLCFVGLVRRDGDSIAMLSSQAG